MALIFAFHEIPDPRENALAVRLGDVRQSVFAGWKSLLRVISEMEPGSMQMSLCFLYTPDLSRGVQGRWRLWLQTSDSLSVSDETIVALVRNGPISEFYPIQQVADPPVVPWDQFLAAGEVVRRLEKIKSYVTREQNAKVPEYYFVISTFQANDANDFMTVDRMLSDLKEPVYFEITVQPAHAAHDAANMYKYVSNLVGVNEAQYRETQNAIEDQRVKKGFRRDHLAEELLRENEEFVRHLRLPQLEFCIRLFAHNPENARLLTSTLAESSFLEGKCRILIADARSASFQQLIDDHKEGKISHSWHHESGIPEHICRLPRMASVNELAGAFRMPVGGVVSPRTIRKHNTDPKPLDTIAKTILIGDDVEGGVPPERKGGRTMSEFFDFPSSKTIEHRLTHDILKKHMFIAGVPGSGKTTAMFNILAQLHRNGIPFLAIEPAKTEYRMLRLLETHEDPYLRALGKTLRIFTPGNEGVSPFRFNPMAFPAGISLDEHINNLMNCFKAAMPMDGPLPALLAKAVEIVYEDHRAKGFPSLHDLVDAVKSAMEQTKYDAEIRSNIETAIEVRLSPLVRRSMGKVFSHFNEGPSLEELMTYPTVIEMDALDQEQANLLTLFVLTAVREQIKVSRRSGSSLTHVIVLEEAHNIVGRVNEDGPPDDPRARATQYVSRMLAELRALGEGIIIADQLPSTVAPAVIKNTGVKLANRLTSKDDREELGHTMLLGDTEIEELARLQPGEAYLYHEKLYRARRVKCIDSYRFLGLDQPPDNETLFASLESEDWFKPWARARLHEDIDDWRETLELLDNEIGIYLGEFDGLRANLLTATTGREIELAQSALLGPIQELERVSVAMAFQEVSESMLARCVKVGMGSQWAAQIRALRELYHDQREAIHALIHKIELELE